MSFLACIMDPKGALAFIVVAAVVTAAVMESLNERMIKYVWAQPWVRRMIPLQRQMAVNFGYPAADLNDEACVSIFSYIVVVCGNHFLNSLLIAPVFVLGWEGAGPTGQFLLVAGVLGDVAYDVYDWIKTFGRTFFHEHVKSWGMKIPLQYFIVLGCLHHPLAMAMATPLVLYHPDLRELHVIALALLCAAGICFLTGSYKFTLDTKTRSGALQYKAIVLLQLVTIYFTRGFVWFSQMYSALCKFHAQGDKSFFVGGLVAGFLMSVFNVLMLADAAQAAIKWLPRPLPKAEEAPKQTFRGSPATLLSSQGSAVKAAVAAQKLSGM